MACWDRNTPWRQGLLFCPQACALLLAEYLGPDTIVAIATHDCDLAQDQNIEPNVEVMLGQKITKLDGNATHAKNARRLQIEFSALGQEQSIFVDFVATKKITIKKAALAAFQPLASHQLTPANHTIFQRWLSIRYRRAAFAEEFERRLKEEGKLAEKINRFLKPQPESILAVLFDVDGGQEIAREGAEDVYDLKIFILYANDKLVGQVNPPKLSNADFAEQVVQKIKDAFSKALAPNDEWQFIELLSCRAISENAMSYAQFKQLKQWRLEYMSLASDPQQELLAD